MAEAGMVNPANKGEANLMLGSVVCMTTLSGKDTDGQLAIVDMRCPEGAGPGPHTDPWRESSYVLEGEFEFQLERDGALYPTRAYPGDTVTIPADEAYGPRSEEAVQTVARTQLPKDIDVAIGTQLQARTPEGRVIPLTVVAADDNVVQLDANHPLAGKDLVFDVELVEIVQAA